MKIAEVLKQISELQHSVGTKIPGTNLIIDEIIPAPTDNQFDEFLEIYLKTGKIFDISQQLNITDFEILILSGSKKKDLFDVKTTITHAWYKDYF